MTEKYFEIDTIPDAARIRHNLIMSILFQPGAKVRQGDLQMEVSSVNDKRNTVTFELIGVYLKPLEEGGNGREPIPENPPPIILTPNKRIIAS